MGLRPKEKKKKRGERKKKEVSKTVYNSVVLLSSQKPLDSISRTIKQTKAKETAHKNKSKSMSISTPNHHIQSLSHTDEENGYIIVFFKNTK